MLALNTVTVVHIASGHEPFHMTVDDVHAVVDASRAAGKPLKALELGWHILQRAGGLLGAPTTFWAATTEGPLDIETLVDRYRVRRGAVREVLVEYLKERAPALDRSSLEGLARALVRRAPGRLPAQPAGERHQHRPGPRQLRVPAAPYSERAFSHNLFDPSGREPALTAAGPGHAPIDE
jgi:hypothetical protein